VTDFWILSAVNGWLKQNGAKGTLPADLALTPVGGAGKGSSASVTKKIDFWFRSFPRTSSCCASRPAYRRPAGGARTAGPEADIEDLLDPKVYEDLARRAYAKELANVTLKLNDKVPRIVRRFELAFDWSPRRPVRPAARPSPS
jgi:hypothetical protein